MIAEIVIYAASLVLVAGAAFGLIAAIGVLRLPDVLTRMHAASKAGAVGVGLILVAVALICFDFGVAIRAIIGVMFLLLTTPVAAHLLAKASHRHGDQRSPELVMDELKSIGGHSPKS